MLNEILQNPKDVQIAKLKLAIKNFKKYDEERKIYYSNALQELGELKSYIAELEDTNKLIAKVGRLESQVRKLNAFIRTYRIKEYSEREIEEAKQIQTKSQLLNTLKECRQEIKSLRKVNSDLIAKLIKYEKQ